MLTPEDIQSREFLVSLRGYDRDEVHAFLDEVAEDFGSLVNQVRGGGGAVDVPAEPEPAAEPEVTAEPEPEPPAAAADPMAAFAAIGAETQRILEAAQAAGEEIRRKAESDAKSLSESRMKEAEQEVNDLREEAAAIRKQIDDLEGRRRELADRLRQARETVDLALIEVDGDMPAGEPADASNSVLAAEAAEEPAVDATTGDEADDDEQV